jgi:hypothetical protein
MLKSHPFFSGIDFNSIVKINPPNLNIIREKIEEYKEKKLTEKIFSEKENKNDLKKETENKEIIPNYINKFNNVNIIKNIKEGILRKKSPWFHYNTRKVILDTSPKVVYIDPYTGIKKVYLYKKSIK